MADYGFNPPEHKIDPPWIMYVYDAWRCGDTMIVLTPDGHLMEALHIVTDGWREKFKVTGVSMITMECKTHTFDQYDEVTHLGKPRI